MPRFAANLSMMFTELPFLDRFARARAAGFQAVEFLFPYEFPAADIAQRLKDNGLQQVLFNAPPGDWAAGERGQAALPGRQAEFREGVKKALDYAAALACPRLHLMAGLAPAGVPRDTLLATYAANLAWAAEECGKAGVKPVIEPINHRDIPGFFLNTTGEARAVIHEVAESNLGLQFDLYHRQIQEGDTATAIREFGYLARHYQIASPPDRGEPDDGEMNYAFLFREIDASGFTGYVGCEYKPRNGTLECLGWAAKCGVMFG